MVARMDEVVKAARAQRRNDRRRGVDLRPAGRVDPRAGLVLRDARRSRARSARRPASLQHRRRSAEEARVVSAGSPAAPNACSPSRSAGRLYAIPIASVLEVVEAGDRRLRPERAGEHGGRDELPRRRAAGGPERGAVGLDEREPPAPEHVLVVSAGATNTREPGAARRPGARPGGRRAARRSRLASRSRSDDRWTAAWRTSWMRKAGGDAPGSDRAGARRGG